MPIPDLPEKDFIHEGYKKNPYPLWLWFILLIIIIAMSWGISGWYQAKMGAIFHKSPFLQVTNRQLSLYLWQNPEHMRVHSKEKSNYLPGFRYVEGVTMDLAASDHYAEAPLELLFLYHTWERLIKSEFIPRPIPKEEFTQFLRDVPEWLPRYWPSASEAYVGMVSHLPATDQSDLAALSTNELPLDVRIAFQGWRNFFKEGEAIEQVKPTVKEMQQFLKGSPKFARNYWRNIVKKQTPAYLKVLDEAKNGEESIPKDQLAPFLRAAFYNYSMAGK